MHTYCTVGVASLVLLNATGAIAQSLNTASDNAANYTRPITRKDVIVDMEASRWATPAYPRDGEWYNVPAPVGRKGTKLRYNNTGPTKSMPLERTNLESPSR